MPKCAIINNFYGNDGQAFCAPGATLTGRNTILGTLRLESGATFRRGRVIMNADVLIREDTDIKEGCTFLRDVIIGKNNKIAENSWFYGTKTGDGVTVGFQCIIHGNIEKDAIIEDFAVLGKGATLGAGKTLHKQSCVEYQGVVNFDVPEFTILKKDLTQVKVARGKQLDFQDGQCVILN